MQLECFNFVCLGENEMSSACEPGEKVMADKIRTPPRTRYCSYALLGEMLGYFSDRETIELVTISTEWDKKTRVNPPPCPSPETVLDLAYQGLVLSPDETDSVEFLRESYSLTETDYELVVPVPTPPSTPVTPKKKPCHQWIWSH